MTDAVGILTQGEVAGLESQAQAIEDEHGLGVYVVIVDDYRGFAQSSVYDAATAVYREYDLGVGADDDGLMLLLSMRYRDYSLITYGDFGNYAFGDDARLSLTDYFLDDFSNDAWHDGLSDYFEVADLYLDAAAAGGPYSADNVIMTDEEAMTALAMGAAAVLLIPLVIALVVIAVLSAKMKSVATAVGARSYAVGGLRLTEKRDDFVRTTRVVKRIPKPKPGGGGGIHHRGGGFSGTSGKF